MKITAPRASLGTIPATIAKSDVNCARGLNVLKKWITRRVLLAIRSAGTILACNNTSVLQKQYALYASDKTLGTTNASILHAEHVKPTMWKLITNVLYENWMQKNWKRATPPLEFSYSSITKLLLNGTIKDLIFILLQ